jgi:HD-GYP domain-containing protein (c-di-GMP phosphodiesterase class II)
VDGGSNLQLTIGDPELPGARQLTVRAGNGPEPVAVVTLSGKPFDYTASDELVCRLVVLQAHRLIERERFVHDLELAAQQQELTIKGVARTVGAMVDTRDPYTAGHQQRVGELAAEIGRRMGMPESDIAGLRIGGYLHDVGKIATPFELLTRPGSLNAMEHAIVQRHSRTGRDLLAPVPFPWPIAEMVDQHHERLDGSGYPAGLSGDEIIPEALIIAVADVFDAITSTRPYRPGRSTKVAMDELRRGAGLVYDRAAVEALIAHVESTGLVDRRSPTGHR